jgi:hypothetical protein
VIKDIFATFQELYPQIIHLRVNSQKSERDLLNVYQKFFTTLRGFFAGVYRSAQYRILIALFLDNLCPLILQDISQVY